jgi:hypothetical protein
MTTTNEKTEGTPGFWKKWWNALVNCFKRNGACNCCAKEQPAPKAEEPKPQDKKATA